MRLTVGVKLISVIFLAILLVLIAAVLYGLLFYAFPWVSQFVNPQEVTVSLGIPDGIAALA